MYKHMLYLLNITDTSIHYSKILINKIFKASFIINTASVGIFLSVALLAQTLQFTFLFYATVQE